MRVMVSLFLLLFFAFLSAYIAKQRGRDPVAWFMIGILLGIFAPPLLLLLKPLPNRQDEEEELDRDRELKVVQGEVEEPQTKSPGDKVWFYLDDHNQQHGPVYFSALKSLWKEEKITSATYVWSESMPQWKRIRDLKDFEDYLLK